MNKPVDSSVAEPATLDKWLAADDRREKWRRIGLLIAFAVMVGIVLTLCLLGDKGIPIIRLERCLLALLLVPWAVYGAVFSMWRRSAIRTIPLACPTCEAAIGDPHALGCTLEECPFCDGQLACCKCIHTVLGLTAAESECLDSPGDDSVDPLKSIIARWEAALDSKGRIPYGPRWFAAEITHDNIRKKPALVDVKITGDVATAEFRTKDGRNLTIVFRRNKWGWLMDDGEKQGRA